MCAREKEGERDGYTENFVLFKAVNVLNQGALYRATGLHDYKSPLASSLISLSSEPRVLD